MRWLIPLLVVSTIAHAGSMSASADSRDVGFTIRRASAPPSIPTANLQVFLDGDDTDGSANSTRTNGVAFNDWLNKGALGGTFSNATGTQQPLFASSLLAGHAGATFDGTDDRLVSSLAASSFTFMHDGTGATIYAVVRTPVSASSIIAATTPGATAADVGSMAFITTTFRTRFVMVDGAAFRINVSSANNTVSTNLFDVLSWTLAIADTPDMSSYVNGASVITANAAAFTGSAPVGTLTVGAAPTGTNPLGGDLVCLLVYDVSHDATQRAAVEAALAAKYGVTFPA